MTVAVFYGGKSCEHDVSVVTGVQAAKLIAGRHTVIPVYVGRDGGWIAVRNYDDLGAYRSEKIKGVPAFLKPNDDYLYVKNGKRYAKIDAALLCVHGAGGEDGALQGALETAGIPYTGSGVAASAIGMDKRLSKRAFAAAGLKTVEGFEVTRVEYENALREAAERAAAFGYPLVVKPASLGSSIGVTLVRGGREFLSALAAAFSWDNAVVVERALENFTELNCGVIGRGGAFAVSEAESPFTAGEILSYDDKYGGGGFKGRGAGRKFPADIPPSLRAEVRLAAAKAFAAVGASGVARVDFMYDNDGGTLYVNEINTIPGSLAAYLFPRGFDYVGTDSLEAEVSTQSPREPSAPTVSEKAEAPAKYGTGSAAVIEELLVIAKEDFAAREKPRYRYKSRVTRGKWQK